MERIIIKFREATVDDVGAIIGLYSDDALGKKREADSADKRYIKAFENLQNEPNNYIYVVEKNGQVIGTAQITFISHLNRKGQKRAQIESIHIDNEYRGQGLGKKLMAFLIEQAKEQGCTIVQLTSDKTRERAHQFYIDLGFEETHIGMKKTL